MGSESNEKSKLEQSFESGADAFGQTLADLTYEEYIHFLISLGYAEATKTVYH